MLRLKDLRFEINASKFSKKLHLPDNQLQFPKLSKKLAQFLSGSPRVRNRIIAVLLHLASWTAPSFAQNNLLEELIEQVPSEFLSEHDDSEETESSSALSLGDWTSLALEMGLEFPDEISPEISLALEKLTQQQPLMYDLRDGSGQENVFDDLIVAQLSGIGIDALVQKYNLTHQQALDIVFAHFLHTFSLNSEESLRVLSFISSNTFWYDSLAELQAVCGPNAAACVKADASVHLLISTTPSTIAHELVHAFLQFLQQFSAREFDYQREITVDGITLLIAGSGFSSPGIVVFSQTGERIVLEMYGGVEAEAVFLSIISTFSLPGADDFPRQQVLNSALTYLEESPRAQTFYNLITNFAPRVSAEYFTHSAESSFEDMVTALGAAISEAELNAVIEDLRSSTAIEILENPVLQDLIHVKIPEIDRVFGESSDFVQGLKLIAIWTAMVQNQYAFGMGHGELGYQRLLIRETREGEIEFLNVSQQEYLLQQFRGDDIQMIDVDIETIANDERRQFYELLGTALPQIFGANVLEELTWMDAAARSIVFSSEIGAQEFEELSPYLSPAYTYIDINEPDWMRKALQHFFFYDRRRGFFSQGLETRISTMNNMFFTANVMDDYNVRAVIVGYADTDQMIGRSFNVTSSSFVFTNMFASMVLQVQAGSTDTLLESGVLTNDLVSTGDYSYLTTSFNSADYSITNLELLRQFGKGNDIPFINILATRLAPYQMSPTEPSDQHLLNMGVFTQNEIRILLWLESLSRAWISDPANIPVPLQYYRGGGIGLVFEYNQPDGTRAPFTPEQYRTFVADSTGAPDNSGLINVMQELGLLYYGN